MMMRGVKALSVGVVALVSQGACRADILSHWRFDETGGTTAADSAGSINGTLLGTAQFMPGAGIAGGALMLTPGPNNVVTMGPHFAFGGTESFTVTVWVKTAPNEAAAIYPLSSHVSTVVRGYLIGINAGGTYGLPGKAYFYTADFPGQEAISTTSVTDGQWHHIAATYSPSAAPAIYVDGAPAEASGVAGQFPASLAAFIVGGYQTPSGSLTGAYNGLIDDVQIYCGVLTPEQIQFLFDHPGEEIGRCPANWNRDCSVSSQDFFDFLVSFFAGKADFNDDGTTNSQDFFDYLTAFFQGC